MVIDVIGDLLKLSDKLKFNEMAQTFSVNGQNYSVFTNNELPTYNINRDVIIISDSNSGLAKVLDIDGRVLILQMPSDWSDMQFRIISKNPYIYAGTIKDVIKQITINQKDVNKYPFIAFVLNINGTTEGEFVNSFDIRILVANITNANMTTIERQTSMSIVRMLTNNLIQKMNEGIGAILPHTHEFKFSENYLMSDIKAIFNDYVDAIELKTTIKSIKEC